jgi:DNA-binding beta-propeller fold protein YncE
MRGWKLVGLVVFGCLVFAGSAGASEGVYVANYDNNGLGGVSQFTIGAGGVLAADFPATAAAGQGPQAIAMSPSGQYVYVVDAGADAVSQYTVGSGGQLVPDQQPTVPTGAQPGGIAVSPNGEYVYVTNDDANGANGVSEYTIGAGGELAADTPPTVSTVGYPDAIAISPNGQYVYVANGTLGTYSISQYTIGASGVLTANGTTTGNGLAVPWGYPGIAISPNGQYLYVTNFDSGGAAGVSQFTIGAGGALIADATGTAATGSEPKGIAVSPNGQYVYVANYADGLSNGGISEFTIGVGGMLTADATPSVADAEGPIGVAVSPDGQYVYVVNNVNDTVSQYSVGAGGMLAFLSAPQAAVATPYELVVAPDSGPTAVFSDVPALAGGATTFTSAATGADEPIMTQTWNFGDGTATASGGTVSHSYANPGIYTVTLTVSDAAGCSNASPFFAGEAGPFTGVGSACSPDPSAQVAETVTIPAIASITTTTIKHAELTARLSCSGTAAESCSGQLVLTTTEHKTGGKVTAVSAETRKPKHTAHTTAAGSASYTLGGGATVQLTLKLNAAAKRLLAKFHKLPAELELIPGGDTTPTATKRVTVTLAKPKHK